MVWRSWKTVATESGATYTTGSVLKMSAWETDKSSRKENKNRINTVSFKRCRLNLSILFGFEFLSAAAKCTFLM